MVSAAELTIDIDVDLHSSIGKLEGLATALRDVAGAQRLVDEDMDIDVGIDRDRFDDELEKLRDGYSLTDDGKYRGPDGNFASRDDAVRDEREVGTFDINVAEMDVGVANIDGLDDMDIPQPPEAETPDTPDSPMGSGDGGVTADGGGSGFLDLDEVMELDELFGDAFDDDSFVNMGGEVMAPEQLLDGPLSDHIDTDEFMEDLFDDGSNVDMGALQALTSNNFEDFKDAVGGDMEQYMDIPTDEDGEYLSSQQISELGEEFGNAFDEKALANLGGRVTSPQQLLEGDLSDHLDVESLTEDIMDPTVDVEAEDLAELDLDTMDGITEALDGDLAKYFELPAGDGGLLQSFKDMDIRMEQMHNALAKVIPLLLVFVGALPAAIAGLVAIGGAALTAAAAFATIGGLGALGFAMSQQGDILENLQEVAQDIRDTFLDTFGPLARQLAPMFEKGVAGLERFFGELAARGDTLLKFRDDAMAFGRFMIDFATTAIQRLGEFSQAAMPIFEEIGAWIEDTDFTNAFAQSLRRAIIPLTAIADAIVRALPAMMQFSQGFLNIAAIISLFFGVLWQLINIIPGFAEALGVVAATMLTLLTVTAMYSAVTALLEKQFVSMATSAIPNALTGLYSLITTKLTAAGASATLASALGMVVSLLTAGLGIAVALVAFEKLNQKISETTGNLKDFGKVSGQMDGMSVGIGEGGSGGTTVVNQNTYNFDGDSRDTRRSVSKARYTDMYFGGGSQ